MGSQNFVVNGGIKMPIGFRFHPTDEELVVHYLKRKALCIPLPASVIPEFDVLQTDPWSLPGDSRENKYFLAPEKCSNGTKNRWLLHQYRLVDSVSTLDSPQVSIGDWLVFRLFQTKRNKSAKIKGLVSNKTTSAVNVPCCIDFTVKDSSVFGPPTSPSSTEEENKHSDGESSGGTDNCFSI
ncbi:Detected protein of unknown function [Hibiscus syriacus]|uniref:NAC domain-containing protein n=1 Tax=Hibiscus syriacus TaxID=106335 RepID=A0A6A2YNC8_HIBSY|nr:Detected protein of unknown function [Hibiscus syriacus]